MTKIKNTTAGPKGVWANTPNGLSLVMIQPGAEDDLDMPEAELESARGTGNFEVDGEGDKPIALSGKDKAELLEIAEAEGVEIEDGATVADIKAAIELHREA
ncbi:hypothetical protein [Sphingomonas trueperi]|uniref:hypothetical protein n=1 Tax=Sphingomonas trueperi TaxID=53317 RepID=UPI0033956527